MKTIIVICALVFLFPACEKPQEPKTPRLSQKELYELQRQCSKDAENWVNRNFGPPAKLTDFTNHYNTKLNKCFAYIVTEFDSGKTGYSFTHEVYDVYEQVMYDHVSLYNTLVPFESQQKNEKWSKEFLESQARKNDEKLKNFQDRTRPYMTE